MPQRLGGFGPVLGKHSDGAIETARIDVERHGAARRFERPFHAAVQVETGVGEIRDAYPIEGDARRIELERSADAPDIDAGEGRTPNIDGERNIPRAGKRAALEGGAREGKHAIDIHALECDEEIIAIFAGVADGHRFSMMFNTYTMSPNSKYSPGLILMRDIIDHYAGQGYRALDLGIGSDDYKRLFCKSDEPIFDSFIPLSQRGKLAAGVMSGLNRTKWLVKHNPALLEMAQKLRSAFS